MVYYTLSEQIDFAFLLPVIHEYCTRVAHNIRALYAIVVVGIYLYKFTNIQCIFDGIAMYLIYLFL